jgi:hypothetical protein
MNWLINRKSQISLKNKITIYKAIIKPVWTYGIELWGCSKPSNTKIPQTFQSKTLRKLANGPWYISNLTLHDDLRIPYVTEVVRTYAKNHKNRTAQNNKQLIRDLFTQPEILTMLLRDNNTILTHKTVTTCPFSKNTPTSHNNIVNFHVYIST